MHDSRTEVTDLAIAGTLRLAPGQWAKGEVLVRDGRIAALTTDAGLTPARDRIDVGDALVLPGAVDAHVHCLSHAGEGMAAATAAAAAGGVTTIIEMPFDSAGPVNNGDRLRYKRDLVEAEAHVDVGLLATLAPQGGWRAAESLASLGACGFKISLFDTDAHRFPRIDDAELLNVLAAAGATGRTVCVHAENNEIIKAMMAHEHQHAPRDPYAHGRSHPPVSETLGVLSALEAAHAKKARLHLCHLSLPRAVDLVGWYAQQGLDVTLETCPHYLEFVETDMEDGRGLLKVNPPIRSSADRDGLWERLERGHVDVIASDHAPWPRPEKEHDDIFLNHSGVPGVETILPVVLSSAFERGPAVLEAAIDALTVHPARRFGLGSRKGMLLPDFDADITVFDPTSEQVIDETQLHSNAGWSPYHGRRTKGRVVLTVSRGCVVWDGQTLKAQPGSGRVIDADT